MTNKGRVATETSSLFKVVAVIVRRPIKSLLIDFSFMSKKPGARLKSNWEGLVFMTKTLAETKHSASAVRESECQRVAAASRAQALSGSSWRPPERWLQSMKPTLIKMIRQRRDSQLCSGVLLTVSAEAAFSQSLKDKQQRGMFACLSLFTYFL